jgi:hypothetical protein
VRSAAMTASSCALVGAGSITLILGRLMSQPVPALCSAEVLS